MIGAAHFDLVAAIFGADTMLTRVVYVLVGLSAAYWIFTGTTLNRRRA